MLADCLLRFVQSEVRDLNRAVVDPEVDSSVRTHGVDGSNRLVAVGLRAEHGQRVERLNPVRSFWDGADDIDEKNVGRLNHVTW